MADVLANESRLIIARPVNHTGPRQNTNTFAVASFAAQIAAIETGRKEPRLFVGDLSKARDFLDVRDVAAAYLQLVRAARQLPDRVSWFNVASGAPRTIESLLGRLRTFAKIEFDIECDQSKKRPATQEIEKIACNASRLQAATGWRPSHLIDDTLLSLLNYCREIERSAR